MTRVRDTSDNDLPLVDRRARSGTVLRILLLALVLIAAAAAFVYFRDQLENEIVLGILGVLAGLFLLWDPMAGAVALTWVIAAWALVTGVLTIISAIRLREEIDNEWWLILSGALAIIFGILAFSNVLAGFLAISAVFGIFAILIGIMSIVLAFRVRDFGTKIGAVT